MHDDDCDAGTNAGTDAELHRLFGEEVCECDCMCTEGFTFPDGYVVILAALLLTTLLTGGWGWLYG